MSIAACNGEALLNRVIDVDVGPKNIIATTYWYDPLRVKSGTRYEASHQISDILLESR